MPLGVEVLIDQETRRRIELSSLDYYTHHISSHSIPPKMTKFFSKLNLTKLFYISPLTQETIIITSQPVDMPRKLSQSKSSQNSPQKD